MKTLWVLGVSLLTASPVLAQQGYLTQPASPLSIEFPLSSTTPALRASVLPAPTVPSLSVHSRTFYRAKPPLVSVSTGDHFLEQPSIRVRPPAERGHAYVANYYPPAAMPRTHLPVSRIGYSPVGYLGTIPFATRQPPMTTVYQPVQGMNIATPYQFGRGLLGQPKVYVRGQPLRNALRFLTP